MTSALVASTGWVAAAQAGALLTPGDLLVTSSTYVGNASTVTVGQTTPGSGAKTAIANGTYPGVFNNAAVDGSFGVTAPLFVTPFSRSGAAAAPVFTAQAPINLTALTGVVTSFPSKSEGALNVNGPNLTFVDYATTPNRLDVSNSNTPGIVEPGNYTQNATARAIVNLNNNGVTAVIPTNAYPGNNGRAAVNLGNGSYVLAGNAGNANGSAQVAAAAGIQVATPATATTTNGAINTTMGGTFNSNLPGDKVAKDNNFRGLTVFNGTVFTTKGSGGNGIDTVYSAGPASGLNPANPITILPGFPTGAATANVANFFPFGIFFANASTLYVADEGAQTNKSSAAAGSLQPADLATAAADANAGLEKWSLVNGVWQLDYVLQNGLGLGQAYTVSGTDFAGDSGSYTVATDGLRNLTGAVNADGTVTLFAVTSTISASGDQGADPNRVVEINDILAATSLPLTEAFNAVETAQFGQVLRGVAIAPADPVPEPATLALLGAGVLGLAASRRR